MSTISLRVPEQELALFKMYAKLNNKSLSEVIRDTMIERMLADETIDSMRCIAPAKEIPHKMWYLSDDGITITPVINDPPECYNMPRQQLKKAYYQNACIDVMRPSVVLDQHSMSGIKVAGYIMDENYDIDTPEEFARAEAALLGDRQ